MHDDMPSCRTIGRGTGLSASYVHRVINGLREPSLGNASRIATYLNMSLDEFFANIRIKRSISRSKRPSPVPPPVPSA